MDSQKRPPGPVRNGAGVKVRGMAFVTLSIEIEAITTHDPDHDAA